MTVKEKKVGNDLTEGSILRSLMIFAAPIVLTNLVQQLYSMVDLAVVGKFVGSTGSVGVSTGGEIADWVAVVAMGFSTAGQIYIAQLYGAKMQDGVKKSIGTLITMMILISIVLGGGSILLCNRILNMLNCPVEALGQARSYMIITSLGFPFVFGYNAVVGVLRGMGESKRPLYFILVSAVINIFADIFLVAVIPLEAAGTAIATVLSQLGSFAASFWFMYKHKERFDFDLKFSYFRMDSHIAWILTKLAVPQVVRSSFVRFSTMWANSNVNAYGLTVSATSNIGSKIQKFLDVFVQGVDTAAAAMVGQCLGARKYDRAAKTIWETLAVCLIAAAFCSFLVLTFPQQIYGILTNDAAVKALGVDYMRIFSIAFIVSATTATFQAMVTGCGFVSLGFVLGILDGVVCRIGISLFCVYVLHMEYEAYWWGAALARVLTGILCIAYFMSGKWKERKLLTEV